ncbi:hypothetical protein OG339_36195 [Streptosporangium sp. NBC_01495]|uniref:hypothetical protein n=1 Tax=Streptosporangium sp. NBC_01495 TaxID=2903899 RepID=UPI002E301E3A|nr:hypothetical protein [Streptosporangium sp. NBC_01495]
MAPPELDEAPGEEAADRPRSRRRWVPTALAPVPGEGARRLGERWVPAVALALIAAQLVWHGVLLGRGYFFLDDLTLTGRAAWQGFGWEFLTQIYGAHLMPVPMAIVGIVTAVHPYGWGLAAASLLILQLGASLAVLRMLRVLFGGRAAILLPLSFYLITPMAFTASWWWAAGLQALSLQIAVAMALSSHVLYLRDGRFSHVLAAAGWTLLGLLSFQLKATVAIPLLLLLVTVLYFPERPRSRVLTRHARAWGVYAGLIAVYSVYVLTKLDELQQSAGLPTPAQGMAFVARFFGVTMPTSVIGGPGRWTDELSDPPVAVIALAWAVIVAVVVLTLLWRRGAWRAWTILFLTPAVLVVPVFLGRGQFFFSAQDTRYLADSALVATLALALATLPLLGEKRPYRRRVPRGRPVRVAGGVVVCAFLAFSVVSVEGYVAGQEDHRARTERYLESVRATLASAPETTDLYPHPLPDDLLWLSFGEENLSSHLLSPLAPPGLAALMRHPRPTTNPQVLDDQGRLVPAEVHGGYAVPASGECFPRAGGVVTIPLRHEGETATLALSYVRAEETAAYVRLGQEEIEVDFARGAGRIFLPVSAATPSIQIEILSPDADLCVTLAALGGVVPA